MTGGSRNVGASVRDRLLRIAREQGEDFQLLLIRYANERLLHRVAESPFGRKFVLKGATLFTIWTGRPHRATRDLDLLGFGDPGEDHVRSVFAEVLATDTIDDGLVFDLESLTAGPIREDQEYGGVRLQVTAHLTSARIRLQIDVGFGDAITPKAAVEELPTILDFPPPRLRVYPRETVVAEKLEAMVQLGLANSRMKDFYDLLVLSELFEFDGQLLARAIRATFERRGTLVPSGTPVALTSEFSGDSNKNTQWTAFLKKSGVVETRALPAAVDDIAAFVEPPLAAARNRAVFAARWSPGGLWAGQ